MPSAVAAPASPRPSAVLNAEIRGLCAGRLVWSAEALAELARLRGEWAAAVARGTELAA
jgi:hypothetical protein